MSIEKLSIKDFLQLLHTGVLIDVRSPGEYDHAHIPGAISLPLFTDEERKIVGTAYKQKSRDEAIKIGLDFFGPKMRKMVEDVESLINKKQLSLSDEHTAGKKVFIYCWRGGMRSAAVAWLLNLYGFKVYTLAGGYKAFRNHVLQTFELPLSFKILGGLTGSGKTAVLKELEKNNEPVVDLEEIACHKGSAFGNINMPKPPTQEMFENILSIQLRAISETRSQVQEIWLEDESQRIGNLNIPSALWESMRTSPLYFLEIPFEERLNYIMQEYGSSDKQKLIDATQRISKRLGGLETKNALLFLEEGNIKEAFRILLHYYDKRYLKGLHNRGELSTLLTKLNAENVSVQNVRLLLTKHQPA